MGFCMKEEQSADNGRQKSVFRQLHKYLLSSNFGPGDASNHNAEGKAYFPNEMCQQQLW